MTKLKKSLVVFCLLFIMALSAVLVSVNSINVYADSVEGVESSEEMPDNNDDNEITPYWLTSLSLSLNGGDGKVWATVRNDFNLFFPKVAVILQLFYSYDYCEDFNKMTVVCTTSTVDLNLGETLVAEASTGGEERFWLARMRWRENSADWQIEEAFARYSADGTFLGIA